MIATKDFFLTKDSKSLLHLRVMYETSDIYEV